MHTISVLICCSYFLSDKELFEMMMAGAVRMTNRFTLTLMFIYMNEMYPNSIRSIGTGMISAVGLLGIF